MGYIQEFRKRLASRDFNQVLQLWDEYCENDVADAREIKELLQIFKESELTKRFGEHIEKLLPQIQQLTGDEYKEALQLLIDVQTHNSPKLADLTMDFIQKSFGEDPYFNEKIRMVGLRTKDNFQGAISNFILLNHIEKGNFVLHLAGWGVGEIIDYSRVREQLTVEFENLSGGKRDISFKNAFKTLQPVPHDHFLALRFANPEKLEAIAKDDPAHLVKILLRDLGPQTASQIKDELAGSIIPEKSYAKWWQSARSKLKRDPTIESPENLKDVFRPRKGEFSHSSELEKAFTGKSTPNEILLAAYNFARDNANALKDIQVKQQLLDKVQSLLQRPGLTESQRLAILLFLDNPMGLSLGEHSPKAIIMNLKDVEKILQGIEIVALKKRVLILIRENRPDWQDIFISLLFVVPQNPLKDYLLKELIQSGNTERVVKRLNELISKPTAYPEALYWYFQKLISGEQVPLNDKEQICLFFEALLLLFSSIDNRPEMKDLTKKIYNLLTSNRFEVTRSLIKDTDLTFIQEFLLLVSKCRAFNDHDQKILRSLAEVVHPVLAKQNKKDEKVSVDHDIIWTTEEGYLKTQEKIKHIGTVEVVDNAKEIEAARALGDLRENSEFKFAMERRSRLQSELKTLSDQFHRARIITKDDIDPTKVGIGVRATIVNSKGAQTTYTILGPWDANPDAAILSLQSKLAQTMLGLKTGDKFTFKDEEFTVTNIASYLE